MSNTSLSTLVDETLEAFEDLDLLRCKSPDAVPLMSYDAIIAALAEPENRETSGTVDVGAEERGASTATQSSDNSHKLYVFTPTSPSSSSMEVKSAGSEAMLSFTSPFGNHDKLREESTVSPPNPSPRSSADSDCDSGYEKATLRRLEELDALFEVAMTNHVNSHPPLEEFGVPCAEAEAHIREELPQERLGTADDLQFYNYCSDYIASAYASHPSSPASSRTASWMNQTYEYFIPMPEPDPGPGRTQGEGPASTEVCQGHNDSYTNFSEADPFRYVGPEHEGTGGPSVSNHASRAVESFYAEDPNLNTDDSVLYKAHTGEQLTFFGEFLRSPFAPASPTHGSINPGLDISPLDTEPHVSCDCQRCYLMEVALTKEFGDPHPMEPWLAGFGVGDPVDNDSELYALDVIKSS